MMNNQSAVTVPALPPPLGTALDMSSAWIDVDLDFDEAADQIIEAHHRDGDARDLPILDLRTWGVVPVDGRFGLAPLAKHHPPLPLRATAFSNLASRLGAPVEFVRDRLPAPLQLATMNYLLAGSEQPIPSTLRLRNGEVTALVSDRYAPLDAEELLSSVRAALVQHGGLDQVRVRSVATGMVDVMRLIFPSQLLAAKAGDVTALGIDISSSSFGRSAVHIRGCLHRLVCSNGLRVWQSHGSFSFRHVGDTQRLRAGIFEAIPSALVAARGTMDKWKAAVTTMVEHVADLIGQMHELTVAERSKLEAGLKEECGTKELPSRIPLYDFVNCVTLAAHDATPARRLELEAMAGDLLSREAR